MSVTNSGGPSTFTSLPQDNTHQAISSNPPAVKVTCNEPSFFGVISWLECHRDSRKKCAASALTCNVISRGFSSMSPNDKEQAVTLRRMRIGGEIESLLVEDQRIRIDAVRGRIAFAWLHILELNGKL